MQGGFLLVHVDYYKNKLKFDKNGEIETDEVNSRTWKSGKRI